jgi:putative transposase
MCEFLGVSKSGYYDWCKRQPCAREMEDKEIKPLIQKIFDDSEGRYGSPRIHKALKKEGVYIARKRVERLMRELQLVARVTRVTYRNVGLREFLASGENLKDGMKAPTAIDQVWVADITYLKVKNRWMYLSVIMDLYSRRIIAWTLARTRTSAVTKKTLQYAIRKRRPKAGLIIHTDRGIEYRSHAYQKMLRLYSIRHSLNRLGHCTDNAHMESYFHSMKAELIRGRRYETEDELRSDLRHYINHFYNAKRLHSGIGYCSPIEYEQLAA